MRERVITFIHLVVFTLCLASAVSAQTKDAKMCAPFTPNDAKLDKYPHLDGRPSDRQLAELGLHAEVLKYPFVGYNYYKDVKSCGGGSWRMEVQPVGSIVWVDASGYKAYLGRCWNRLVWHEENYKPAPAPVVQKSTSQLGGWRGWWATMWRPVWGTVIEVLPNGGNAEVTVGDVHVKANGQAEVRIIR